ncbi:50S ribosomal protein L5 [Candidatus Micrarchaeota archaeon]|nr:50S ribosomal protein L5 [Candidatus Micrarchaeota archaeon]
MDNSNSANTKENSMKEIFIEKITVNIGVGSPGERLEHAKNLISKLTGNRKPLETLARKRDPVFKLRKGLPIGVKVTIRGKDTKGFVEKALTARRRPLGQSNFDKEGNISFGVPEYIDFPGAKYDPTIGMFGFDVCVTLARSGKRVALRRFKNSKIGKSHKITKEEGMDFMVKNFNAKIE